MSCQYLFGPVSSAFAQQSLQRQRQRGECVVFDYSDSDVHLNPNDTWQSFSSRFPSGFRPQFLVLMLQYRVVPPWLFAAPLPIIGLAGDWNLLWHYYRKVLRRCDLVLSDPLGVETLEREGIRQAIDATLFGYERRFVEEVPRAQKRDIDILFVGNLHPAIHSERLEWLGRLAPFANKWNVLLTTDVFGADYRHLLSRARIVFNRSIRGEANGRTFEAAAVGALLFQESENRAVRQFFTDRQECVYYSDADLEKLLTYYLEHEDERQAIAAAAFARAAHFTFEAFWDRHCELIERHWPSIQKRAQQRRHDPSPTVPDRIWQLVSSTSDTDPTLISDLARATRHCPRDASLACTQGIIEALCSPQNYGAIAQCFQNAWLADPRHVVAGMNLALVLEQLGQKDFAVDQARRVLAILELDDEPDPEVFDAVPYPSGYGFFRVEWEKAAWTNAGDRLAEVAAKKKLVRWELHQLRARCSGDIVHDYEACLLNPRASVSQVSLGCSLLRRGKYEESLPHLQAAVRINPFDRDTARAYHEALGLAGLTAAQKAFSEAQRLLARAAPTVVPVEPWFAETKTPAVAHNDRKKLRIIWQGTQNSVHSLAHVNRQICLRLIERGHELALRPSPSRECTGKLIELPPLLQQRMGRQLPSPDVVICHHWPPSFTPPPEGHWVIMPPWEFGSLPAAWVGPMTHQVDEVWVPSNFVRQCFIHSGIPADQVHVVPLAVSSRYFEAPPQPFRLATSKRYKFLFVGETMERKGIDILLKTYAQVFSHRDDVCLVIKGIGVGTFYQGLTADALIRQFKQQPRAPAIDYLAQELSDDQMIGLYAACDCLVHPFRGESFALPVIEAMASGLPVIVTGYGPTLDYCTQDTAYLLPARVVQLTDELPQELRTVAPAFWAEPDQDALRFYLRRVFEKPDEARVKGAEARTWIRQHFMWDHTAHSVEQRLRRIFQGPIRRRSSQ